jgi:hypothetical protein
MRVVVMVVVVVVVVVVVHNPEGCQEFTYKRGGYKGAEDKVMEKAGDQEEEGGLEYLYELPFTSSLYQISVTTL